MPLPLFPASLPSLGQHLGQEASWMEGDCPGSELSIGSIATVALKLLGYPGLGLFRYV